MTLVDELRDRFGVEPVLRVIGVAVSTYYGWLVQAANPSARRREDAELAVEIAEIHDVSGGTYGSPRLHAMLHRRGRHVGRKRVERLMRDAGLQGAFLQPRSTGRTACQPARPPFGVAEADASHGVSVELFSCKGI
ncbi:IS3 family transposase [Micromonospora sp. NPDC050276]|uniref:IS3 family transposase n=1 Tax=Micromonospora sp. NPDC050276 TaxID=3364278 RepID=UPI0037949F52